jgi:DNA invertase Pin-like site-specific DNA recombinase
MKEGFTRRAQAAFKRKWVLFIRQSTMFQRLHNVGSGDVQAQQHRHLERMDVRDDQVVTIDARGESGRAEIVRHFFEELVRLIETGTVGVLVLARFDRLGRNSTDSARVLNLLAKHGGMLLVDGRIYDPREPHDQLTLGMQSNFAEFENRARARWMQLARLAVARRLQSVIPVPTGLTWADVTDPSFCARMEAAGLADWLVRTKEHRAAALRGETRLHVMPYPDREVYDAARLRLDWLLETQDLAAVRARIRDPLSGWPRRGMVPLVRSWVYSAQLAPEWIPVEYSDQEAWYLSPALYTIYGYAARALAEADEAPLSEFAVWEPHAFPSFAAPEDRQRVVAFLERGQSKPWKAKTPIRDHLLSNVRCAKLRDGRPCGRRMTAVRDGPVRLYGTFCRHPRPHGRASLRIEEPVIEVMLAAFDPTEIRRAVEGLRRDRDAVLKRRSEAKAMLDSLEAQARAAMDLAIEAKAEDKARLEKLYKERHADLATKAMDMERSLAALCEEEAAIRAVTDEDYKRVLALASDLPSLIERARVDPPLLRRLVGELISAVHVLPLAHGVVELGIEFPTGVRVRRLVETHPANSTQPQRLYAAHRFAKGASADAVAAELGQFLQRNPSFTRFKARRVETMAAMHVHAGDIPPREGEQQCPRALAARYGVPEALALEATLQGILGPASWADTGTLAVVPTDREVAWAFPEWGRRQVAAQQGWPVEDTVTIPEAMDVLKLTRSAVEARARRTSGAHAFPAYRVWVRKSHVADPEGALTATLRDARPDLDPACWVPMRVATKQLGVARATVRAHFPVVQPGFGPNREDSWYAWLHPDQVAEHTVPSLVEAVAALGVGYDPEEFLLIGAVANDLTSRVGCGGEWALREAARRGHIVTVRARQSDHRTVAKTYVHVPAAVRTASSGGVVRAWLRGDLEGPSTRAGSGEPPHGIARATAP